MKKQKISYYVISALIIVGGVLIDQITKLLAVKFLMPMNPDSVTVIKGILNFTYLENTGMAFGLLPDKRWIFMLVSTVMIVALAVYLYLGRAENRLYLVSIAMIISGGIGNMIDRIALGYVVDFIDVRLFDFWKWIFNVADSLVCVGAGLLILALLIDLVGEIKKEKAKHENNG